MADCNSLTLANHVPDVAGYYKPAEPKHKKFQFETQHEWGRVFKILNKCKMNPKIGLKYRYGRTVLGKIVKAHPNSLRFNIRKYFVNEKRQAISVEESDKSKKTHSIFIKNGVVSLFSVQTQGESKIFRNISGFPRFFLEKLGVDKESHIQRLSKAINIILKENGIKKKVSSRNLAGSLLRICYPALTMGIFKNMFFEQVPTGLSPLFRKAEPLSSIVWKIFGSAGRQTMRETVEAIRRNASLNVFKIYFLRKLAPFETLRELLQLPKKKLDFINPELRKFLLMFPKERRVSLVKQLFEVTPYDVTDSIRLFKQLKEREPTFEIQERRKTWRDMHDYMSRQYNRIMFPNVPVKVFEPLEKIDGCEINGYKIVVPRDSHTMMDWGSELNNCVGSYSGRVGGESCVVFGLFKNDKIEFCIELSRGRVNQFSGRFRAAPEKELTESVRTLLFDNGLLFEGKDKIPTTLLDMPF